MTMAQRVSKSKATAFFVDEDCHPQNIAVMRTRAEPLGIEIITGHREDFDASKVFGAIVQYPGTIPIAAAAGNPPFREAITVNPRRNAAQPKAV